MDSIRTMLNSEDIDERDEATHTLSQTKKLTKLHLAADKTIIAFELNA